LENLSLLAQSPPPPQEPQVQKGLKLKLGKIAAAAKLKQKAKAADQKAKEAVAASASEADALMQAAKAAMAKAAAAKSSTKEVLLGAAVEAAALAASEGSSPAASSAAPSDAAPLPSATAASSSTTGQILRITDETLGPSGLCGKIVEVLDGTKDVMLCRVQGKGVKACGQVCLTRTQVENMAGLKDATPFKGMYLKVQEKVILDKLFMAEELKGKASLETDPRLTSIHINIGIWLIKRDFPAEVWERAELVDPNLTMAIIQEMTGQTDETADSLCKGVAELRALFQKKELICLPVWGGVSDGEFHWTLLTVWRKDGLLEITYRDSLSWEHPGCKEMAKLVMMVVQMALEINTLCAVPPVCNLARQKPGSGACGLFVIHYMASDCRKLLGEGLSAGYPDVDFWSGRLQKVVDCVIKNEGVADLQKGKMKEELAQMEADKIKAKDKAKVLAEKIASSLQKQAEVQKMAALTQYNSFGSLGGCPQCKGAQFGSTCCNPAKIEAKFRAENERAEELGQPHKSGVYNKKRYEEILHQIGLEIIFKKTGEVLKAAKMPDKDAKGGGDFVHGVARENCF